jgi:alpha-N-acetylglucosamine transferase
LEKGMGITSLAADPVNEILYFSTQLSIYAYKKNSLVMLSDEFPGSYIKYFGNGLIVFNPRSKDILRIVNVASSIDF